MKLFPHHVKGKDGLYRRTLWHTLYWFWRCGDVAYYGWAEGPGLWVACSLRKGHPGRHNHGMC